MEIPDPAAEMAAARQQVTPGAVEDAIGPESALSQAPTTHERAWVDIATLLAAAAVLVIVARLNYLAFHVTVELATITVMVTIFAISWHTYRLSTNGYLTLVGMAALPIAGVTFLHALTYFGMPAPLGLSKDLPTQLWLVARFLTVAAFIIAPTYIGRRLARPFYAFVAFGATAVLLVGTVFLGLFPSGYLVGQGLTPFKIASEYAIMLGFAVALWLLWRNRAAMPADVCRLLATSITLSIAAEALFTTYTDVYGITNMIGHLVYLASFYALYRALVDAALERPYEALFRELAQSEASVREAHRFSEGLNQIDAAINSTLDSDQILSGLLERAGSVLGADAAVLSLLEGDRFHPRYFWGYSGSEFDDTALDRDIGRHLFRAWELRRPVTIEDTQSNPIVSSELVDATGAKSILASVLVVRDEPIGGLGFHWRSSPHTFTDGEIDFARKVSTALSMALENARAFATEHEIAEALQTDMASAVERISGVEIGQVYLPAPGPGRIGGDFFDVFALDANRLAFLIGDVAGRGLAAANTNATTRSIVRALALVDPEPGVVLQRASDSLARQLESNEFVTAAFGVLDVRDGSSRIAIFGHPDPVVVGRTDFAPPEGARCPPLGVSPGGHCPVWRLTLDPGETLLLFTDGVLETRCGHEFFGAGRLDAVLRGESPDASAQGIADGVLGAVLEFAGGHASDDLAILAIRYLGP